MTMEYIISGCYWGFLITAAIQDLLRKKVDLWIYAVFGILAVGGNCYLYITVKDGFFWLDFAAGTGIGILLLGLAAVSRGGIGIGDGCFFCVSGWMLGFWKNLSLLCIGTLLCGTWSLVLIVRNQIFGQKCAGLRKNTVPFIPFVLAAAVCMEIGGKG